MPRISVLMTTYNDGIELFNSISSILNQSFSDFEFIICDDCSSSKLTRSILSFFENRDKRVVLLENQENIGFCRSLNRCVSFAKGDFLARMDADDVSLPDRFQKEIDFLLNHCDVSFCGSSFYLFDAGGVWGKALLPVAPTREDVFAGGAFAHPSIMMRKKDLDKVSDYTVFPQKIRAAEDYDLWCKFYFQGGCGANLPEPLLLYFDGVESYKKRIFSLQKNKRYLEKKWRGNLRIDIFFYLKVRIRNFIISLLPRFLYKRLHRKSPSKLLIGDEKATINVFLNNQRQISNGLYIEFLKR